MSTLRDRSAILDIVRLAAIAMLVGSLVSQVAEAAVVQGGPARRIGSAVWSDATNDDIGVGCAFDVERSDRQVLIFVTNAGKAGSVLLDPATVTLTSIRHRAKGDKRRQITVLTAAQYKRLMAASLNAQLTSGPFGSGGSSKRSSEPARRAGSIDLGGATSSGSGLRVAGPDHVTPSRGLPSPRELSHFPDLVRREAAPGGAVAGLVHFRGKVADALEVVVSVGDDEYAFLLERSAPTAVE